MIAQGTRGNGTRDEVVQTACELTRVVYNSAAMEPRIQYAKTADGVNIAFWTLGAGQPLVYMPNPPWSHVQLEWGMPELRRWYERLAEKRRLIRYDSRGCGLSERNVADFSLDAQVLDLEAVVDRLGLGQFALLGFGDSGPAAVAYAARHPERISRLILWCTYSRFSDYFPSQEFHAEFSLRDGDWKIYTETLAHLALGWSEGDQAHQLAAFMRECVAPETMRAFFAAISDLDVTGLLPLVRSPTLVLHRRQIAFLDVNAPRAIVSLIPDARLALLEGTSYVPFLGDVDSVLTAVEEFLGEGEAAVRVVEAPQPGAFRTVLFTDVEGSTALTQRLGDAKAREVMREHERMTREALRAHGGTEVKALGDGFMASFSSATRALECAIAMQQAFAEHNAALLRQAQDAHTEPVEAPVQVRIRVGLNAGEPIAEDEDLFGTAVILAARIAAKAEGGEILASDVVRQLVAGKGFLFADRGDVVLRGFEDPVRLYEVRWEA
jgi:class 3 adenylate cyclase/pimeloyl-ACP methyl ester carboxylesterase